MPLGNRLVGLKTHKVVIHYNGNYYTAEYRRSQFFYELHPRVCLRSILANRKQWYVTYWSNGSSPGPGGVEIMGAREPFIYGRGKELIELKVKIALIKSAIYWDKVIQRSKNDDKTSSPVEE
jgi:hypothetical protein